MVNSGCARTPAMQRRVMGSNMNTKIQKRGNAGTREHKSASIIPALLCACALMLALDSTYQEATAANVDCGLRMFDGTTTVTIFCENPPVSRLRIRQNGVTYGVALVDPGVVGATHFQIQTPEGTKALQSPAWNFLYTDFCVSYGYPYPPHCPPPNYPPLLPQGRSCSTLGDQCYTAFTIGCTNVYHFECQ